MTPPPNKKTKKNKTSRPVSFVLGANCVFQALHVMGTYDICCGCSFLCLLASRYVPDTSKVRQKMLYASSKKDLLLKLGSSLFADDDFYVGEASDLTFDGLVHSTRKATHAERAEMLTEAEAAHVVSISEKLAYTSRTRRHVCWLLNRVDTAGSL